MTLPAAKSATNDGIFCLSGAFKCVAGSLKSDHIPKYIILFYKQERELSLFFHQKEEGAQSSHQISFCTFSLFYCVKWRRDFRAKRLHNNSVYVYFFNSLVLFPGLKAKRSKVRIIGIYLGDLIVVHYFEKFSAFAQFDFGYTLGLETYRYT